MPTKNPFRMNTSVAGAARKRWRTVLPRIGQAHRRIECAPEIGPNVKISAASAAPVAIVFASNARAVPASQPLAHDPRTHHRGHQEAGCPVTAVVRLIRWCCIDR
jgi:hypothetical protein